MASEFSLDLALLSLPGQSGAGGASGGPRTPGPCSEYWVQLLGHDEVADEVRHYTPSHSVHRPNPVVGFRLV